MILTLSLLASCASTPQLPKLYPISDDSYPPYSRRLGEEGRVLVEFHLDTRRRPFDVIIRRTDPKPYPEYHQELARSRLNEGAMRVVRSLPFVESDKTKPNSKHAYRATIIFCLQPGDCDAMVPFPGTEAIMVKAPAFVGHMETPIP